MNEATFGFDVLGGSNVWLPSWIAEQLRSGSGRRADLRGVVGDAMYVFGSIGVDAALTSSAEVWVGEYDFDTVEGATATLTWHRASGTERVGFLVIATRRFPALEALLPQRPVFATACAACRGTGDWHLFSADRKESLRIGSMICKECGGLGWRATTPKQ
jgi:hypothetical protein